MGISEALIATLKTKSHILTVHVKDDFLEILGQSFADLNEFLKQKNFREKRLKTNLKDFYLVAKEAMLLLWYVPVRFSSAMRYLKNDVLAELEKISDHEERTAFGLKLLGSLVSAVLAFAFQVQRGHHGFRLKGTNSASFSVRVISMLVLFKLLHRMVLRLIHEMERELQDPEELRQLSYFRDMLQGTPKIDLDHGAFVDPAVDIVENLKKYLMTGKRKFE